MIHSILITQDLQGNILNLQLEHFDEQKITNKPLRFDMLWQNQEGAPKDKKYIYMELDSDVTDIVNIRDTDYCYTFQENNIPRELLLNPFEALCQMTAEDNRVQIKPITEHLAAILYPSTREYYGQYFQYLIDSLDIRYETMEPNNRILIIKH